jgi:hypothetical protein
MFTAEQITGFISDWVQNNPVTALRTLITMKPIREYIVKTLEDEDLDWLSSEIKKNPVGLLTYINSRPGRRAFRDALFEYKQSVTPIPTNSKSTSEEVSK